MPGAQVPGAQVPGAQVPGAYTTTYKVACHLWKNGFKPIIQPCGFPVYFVFSCLATHNYMCITVVLQCIHACTWEPKLDLNINIQFININILI